MPASIVNNCSIRLFNTFQSLFKKYEDALMHEWDLKDITLSKSVDVAQNTPLIECIAKTRRNEALRLIAVACLQSDVPEDIVIAVSQYLLAENICRARTIVYIDTASLRPHLSTAFKDTAMRVILSIPVHSRRHVLID